MSAGQIVTMRQLEHTIIIPKYCVLIFNQLFNS